MKKMIVLALTMVAFCTVALSQRVQPKQFSMSAGNYKDPQKARLARKYNLDQSTILTFISSDVSDNYKQPHTKRAVVKAAISSPAPEAVRRSYKHPYGL